MKKQLDSILGFLQKIGKSIMVPIAVMPALGLLLRLGDTDLLNIPWLKAAGGAAFGTNMAMLFAVGIGFGLSKESNGVGGLAGLLGYLVMTSVAKTFNASINMGVFGGILAGVVGGLLYNKFHNIRVPAVLGFFGGKRFVPIITSAVCVLLGLFFGYVWPMVQNGLNDFAVLMTDAGWMGAGIYGFLNRLLIPIGLHHVLNTVVWFQLGTFTTAGGVAVTGDISRFLAGDPTAGVYTAGFYPIVMFGLPSACLAMYTMAKKSKKKQVGGMFLSLALTAFITGITEPIEFTFMFLSPVLYFFHAILTGVSMAVAYALNIHLAFSFSSGLMDYLLYFGKGKNAILLLIMGAVAFVVYYFLFVFFIKKFDLKTPGREDDDIFEGAGTTEESASKDNSLTAIANGILKAIGGKANIEVLDNCVTRLRLTLKDVSIIDEAKIKSLGSKGIMKLGSNNVQIIMGTLADPIAAEMKDIVSGKIKVEEVAEKPKVRAKKDGLAGIAEGLLEAIGGKENIEVLDNCVTRLRLTLKDASIIDEPRIKALGAKGIMKLGSNNVQIIMGTLADPIAGEMKKLV
jgi:PTS system N-acetylglucosamine-specific IIC component|nr:N-acetylglucosamine-specific PTS transporter subunit IIBC [uncultured Clostridium sp.]